MEIRSSILPSPRETQCADSADENPIRPLRRPMMTFIEITLLDILFSFRFGPYLFRFVGFKHISESQRWLDHLHLARHIAYRCRGDRESGEHCELGLIGSSSGRS